MQGYRKAMDATVCKLRRLHRIGGAAAQANDESHTCHVCERDCIRISPMLQHYKSKHAEPLTKVAKTWADPMDRFVQVKGEPQQDD